MEGGALETDSKLLFLSLSLLLRLPTARRLVHTLSGHNESRCERSNEKRLRLRV